MATNSKNRTIEFTIKPGGEIEVDQQGYDGKNCAGDIDGILNALGKEKKTQRKREWYRDAKVRINQKR